MHQMSLPSHFSAASRVINSAYHTKCGTIFDFPREYRIILHVSLKPKHWYYQVCTLSSEGHITSTQIISVQIYVDSIYINNALDIISLLFLSNIAQKYVSKPKSLVALPFCFSKLKTLNDAIFILWGKVIQTGFVEMICHVAVYLQTHSYESHTCWT